MGFLMRKQNRPAEAEPFLRQALDASRTVLGEDHPDRMVFLINMGTLSRDLRKPDQAEAYFREAVERCGRTVGADHPYTRAGIQNLGEVLLQEQRFSDAAQLLAEAEPSFRKAVAASDNGVLGTILLNLGKARVGLAQFPIAEANLIESHAIRVKAWGAAHKDTRDSLQALVDLYTAWEKAEPDNGYDAKAAEWRAKLGTEELKVDN